jgi:hypothetical protein
MTAARRSLKRTPPSLLVCAFTLAAVDLHAHLRGLRSTLGLAARRAAGAGAADDAELVTETARRVSMVAAFYPRRARCLEQSLALCLLLRRRGVAAELRLGAQPRPFYAHAWVEVNGVPVAEQGDLPLNMTIFPNLGA